MRNFSKFLRCHFEKGKKLIHKHATDSYFLSVACRIHDMPFDWIQAYIAERILKSNV